MSRAYRHTQRTQSIHRTDRHTRAQTLYHEIPDHSVELAALVPKTSLHGGSRQWLHCMLWSHVLSHTATMDTHSMLPPPLRTTPPLLHPTPLHSTPPPLHFTPPPLHFTPPPLHSTLPHPHFASPHPPLQWLAA